MNGVLRDGHGREVLPSLSVTGFSLLPLAREGPKRREAALSSRRKTEGTRPTRFRPDTRTQTRV